MATEKPPAPVEDASAPSGAGRVPDAVRRRLSTLDNWLNPYSWLVTAAIVTTPEPPPEAAECWMAPRMEALPSKQLKRKSGQRGVSMEPLPTSARAEVAAPPVTGLCFHGQGGELLDFAPAGQRCR